MKPRASGPPRKKLAPTALRNANRGGTSGSAMGDANATVRRPLQISGNARRPSQPVPPPGRS
jgi:hypothetical protein